MQVKLLSSDSQSFEVDIEVAKQSQTLRDTIEGEGRAGRREGLLWGVSKGLAAGKGGDAAPLGAGCRARGLSAPALRAHAEVGGAEVVPIPNVTSKILAKVIEFCDYHVKAEQKDDAGAGAQGEVARGAARDASAGPAALVLLLLPCWARAPCAGAPASPLVRLLLAADALRLSAC